MLYSFCSGEASLADAERPNDEPLARRLGKWLRGQSDASVAAVCGLVGEFIAWVLDRAVSSRWNYAGRAEAFFDAPQLEVHDTSFEGAKINYNATSCSRGRRFGSARSSSAANSARPAM